MVFVDKKKMTSEALQDAIDDFEKMTILEFEFFCQAIRKNVFGKIFEGNC